MINRYFKASLSLISFFPRFSFLQTKLTPQKLNDLRIEYKVSPSLHIFDNLISNNSDYFRIFQLIQKQPFNQDVYMGLRKSIGALDPQNDNILLLRAKISCKIAQNFAVENKNMEADQYFNESLEILQQSLLPNIMQYYSVYRKYGIYLSFIGNKQKATEVLSESVEILAQYVKHSDDPVTANYHSIQQAKACVKLIYLQPEQRQKWLKLSNSYWKQCEHGVHDQIEYAQTVYENYMDKLKVNPKKARLYAEVELDKIKNEKYHEIVTKAFQE